MDNNPTHLLVPLTITGGTQKFATVFHPKKYINSFDRAKSSGDKGPPLFAFAASLLQMRFQWTDGGGGASDDDEDDQSRTAHSPTNPSSRQKIEYNANSWPG